MFKYILKRLLQMIPLVIIISLIAFGIIRIAEVYAGANPLALLKMNPATTEETIQREKLRLGYESSNIENIKLNSSEYELKQGFTMFIQKIVDGSLNIKDTKNNTVMLPTDPSTGEFKIENDTVTFNKEDSSESVMISYKDKDGKEQKEKVNLLSTTYILNKEPGSEESVTIENLRTKKQFTKMQTRPKTFMLKGKIIYFDKSDVGKDLEIKYNTPNPWYKRYLSWAFNFIQGNMGQSYYFKTDVNSLIFERITNTLVLSVSTITFTWIVALPLGIFLAVRQYSLIDQVLSSISYFFMGFPDFFLAILLLLFAASTGWFPITGMTNPSNNNMYMAESIYNGTYMHDVKDKVSAEHKKMDAKVYNMAQKDLFVKNIIADLNLELSVKQEYISSTTTTRLLEDLPKIEGFDKQILTKVKNESVKHDNAISMELARDIRTEIARKDFLPFGEKAGYVMQHFGKLIYHYLANIPDVLYHLFLPTLTLSLISIASLQRRMRANLLDVLNEEYIRTARAKGLAENVVIYKHAVRNAINPIITLLGFEFASLLSGAAFVEIIFTWPGLGQMMLDAVLGSDLNLVMAGLVIGSVMLLIGNLLADLLLGVIDPRIKLEA